MLRDLDYEINNGAFDYQYMIDDKYGIQCKNYEVCKYVLPKWWFKYNGNYLCTECHLMFGTWGSCVNTHTEKGILEIRSNIECSICLEYKRGISYPRCNHTACIECFKRCMYGDDNGEPVFPYPDIEYEYDKDRENAKWKDEYPLIEKYKKNHSEWEDENNKHLQLCSLCRA